MSTIVTRAGKGSPLTHVEVDANFTNLNTDKVEKTSADITGGTINGTTIGATTPSSIVGTTITGQTARLNGTGSNLLTYSQDFTQGVTNFASTVTLASGTAPDSTNTANKFVGNSSVALHALTKSTVFIANTTYTFSIYLKKAELQYIQLGLDDGNANGASVNIDLNTMTAVSSPAIRGTGTGFSVAITNVGSGWSRIALTGNPSSAIATTRVAIVQIDTSGAAWTASSTGNGTSGYLIWGAQLEANSTANTYIPTTTTAVYGTPTLSFSGVSTLGLESNGALFLQPAGTGAIQAQATTSTATGGNVRGTNAVDWQTSRSSAGQVASGAQSVVAGGINNTASGQYSVVAGLGNTSSGSVSYIGGGNGNAASSDYSTIVSGRNNTSAGYFNFIGTGQSNSGTASAAVTTQSGTMNATTAVTLSGSNANIKVGQLITGTSIALYTYVAAISGTSLTLSQAASGSSTSTLSFFTPHGVVVGGGNNQATGSYSFIGGGGDAGTAANRNVASGAWSFVGGGRSNTASGDGSFIGGGGTNGSGTFANLASGAGATILGGFSNTSSGTGSSVLGGFTNTANQTFSTIVGGSFGTARSIVGNTVFPSSDAPISGNLGITQAALLILAKQTTDATPTALCSSAAAAGTGNQVILPNNSAYFFRGEVVSGKTAGGDTKGWTIEGVIKRGANAASTALVGIPTVTSTYADLGAATWDIAVTADTTNGGIRVTFTGQAATTIRTVCQIRTTEMTF